MAIVLDSDGRLISAKFLSKIGDKFVELYATEWSNTYEVTDEIRHGKLIVGNIESVVLNYLLDKRYSLVETLHLAKMDLLLLGHTTIRRKLSSYYIFTTTIQVDSQ